MKIRVYYEDTDCGGMVYYANYLRYMERSRTEYLRERGVSLAELQREGIVFVVVHADITYRAAARYEDLLDVKSYVMERTSVSVTFHTTIVDERGRLLVKGDVKLACAGPRGRAVRIPPAVAGKLDVVAQRSESGGD